MQLLRVLVLFALCGTLFSQEEDSVEGQEDSSVIKLTLDNFDDVIQENAVILVEFFAPW